VVDVSDDGRRIAATVRRLADNPTTDHRRYGDPTYLAPSRVTLQVIDATTGSREEPFTSLVNVRDAAWSRDARQLAVLIVRDPAGPDAYPTTALYVWEAEKKALAEVKLTAGSTIALNSGLTWTPEGLLIVALRNPELDREAGHRWCAGAEPDAEAEERATTGSAASSASISAQSLVLGVVLGSVLGA
jgi:hypothetical protein